MEAELLKMFPEFGLIQDLSLRHKTAACWIEAMQSGGWQLGDLEKIPFTLLIPDCPVNFRTHVRAVVQTAVAAAEIASRFYSDFYTINKDFIVAGGLLHDIGKLLEYQRQGSSYAKSQTGVLLRHPFTGAGLAMKHDLPREVVHLIATHAGEGEGGYRTPESVILHYADYMNFESLKSVQSR